MNPIVAGALIGGGASFLGGMFSNAANQSAADRTNAFNAEQAHSQRMWQQNMDSTAYVRATNDMRNAGLNPMLAYQQGGGSTPGGAAASGVTPQLTDVLGRGVSSALETARLRKDLEQAEAGIGLAEAQKMAARADAVLKSNNSRTAAANAQAAEAELPAIRAQAKVDEARAKIDEKAVTADAILQRLGRAAGIINDATGALRPKIQIGGQRPRNYEPQRILDERRRLEKAGEKGISLD